MSKNTTYSVTIESTSKELTARERVAIKDFTNAIALDEATKGKSVVLNIDYYAVLRVHNEKSDNTDYMKVVFVTKDGLKYVTGSENFFDTFIDIWDEMKDTDEEFSIEAYQVESKNYKGKTFLTCSIV